MSHPALRLTGRSSSHFTRVARMFAHELNVPLEFAIVHDLTALEAATFDGNPALKLPTLHVGPSPLFGTENICRRLIELAGRTADPRIVLPEYVTADLGRNAQEMVWHAMAAQVQLRMGLALAKLSADNVFFTKIQAGMAGALTWLETHLDQALALLPASRDVSLFEVTLFCLLEHIAFSSTLPLDRYIRLLRFASAFGERESARRTSYRFDPRPDSAKA